MEPTGMSTGLVLLISIIALLVQFGLLILAIKLATEKERKYHKIQTEIMIKMAQKAGVSRQEIDELFIKERIKIL